MKKFIASFRYTLVLIFICYCHDLAKAQDYHYYYNGEKKIFTPDTRQIIVKYRNTLSPEQKQALSVAHPMIEEIHANVWFSFYRSEERDR